MADHIAGWSFFEEIKRLPLLIFFTNIRQVFKLDDLGVEIAQIAIPAVLALTADPIASLVDTAFIGRIGKVELAAAGVAIAVFNQASKIAVFPLVSVTTSFVAEEDAGGAPTTESLEELEPLEAGPNEDDEKNRLMIKLNSGESRLKSDPADRSSGMTEVVDTRRHIPSASSALIIGTVLGLIQAIFLISNARPLLSFMGVRHDSLMLRPALRYLTLRSLGAPATLLSLAIQGVFRGFKDTKTPLYAIVAGDVTNIVLDPVFIFVFQMGVRGAAIAHIISQYLIATILFWQLMKQVHLLSPNIKHLQFGRFLKNGFLLLMRVLAATFCVTLAASMAARQGPNNMAAFQVCLQVWMTTSLLADGLAIAGQAILARAFAKEEYHLVTEAAARVLQLGLVLGFILAVILGVGFQYAAQLFTQDAVVLSLIGAGIPFVAATQPLNALAFVFDGVNFGASDFSYSAYSMIIVAIVSIFCLLVLSSAHGFIGIWIALTIYMALRAFAGFWRLGTGAGPWKFLRG